MPNNPLYFGAVQLLSFFYANLTDSLPYGVDRNRAESAANACFEKFIELEAYKDGTKKFVEEDYVLCKILLYFRKNVEISF